MPRIQCSAPAAAYRSRLLSASACAAALAALWASHAAADVVSSTFVGSFFDDWSNPANWNPAVVPNNAGGTTYNVDLGGMPVELLAPVTIDNLTGQTIQVLDGGALTVNNTTALTQAQVFATTGNASASLGSLAGFSTDTKTLDSTWLNVTSNGPAAAATLRFNGADVVTNNGSITLQGQAASITDELGNDALRHLAENNGTLILAGRSFTTAGDFYNGNNLTLGQPGAAGPTNFIINGNLQNFDPASRTLSGGHFYLSGTAAAHLQFNGADVVHEAAFIEIDSAASRITDQFGNDALRNLAEISAGGTLFLARPDFTTAGDFTVTGELYLGQDPAGPGDVARPTFTVTGQLANYDAATHTLSGGSFGFDGGTLKFPGADVVNNASFIEVFANGMSIADENGNDGLRHLSHNLPTGTVNVFDGPFATPGDFNNEGTLSVTTQTVPDAAGSFTVHGALTNSGTVSVNEPANLLLPGAAAGTFTATGSILNIGSITIHPLGIVNTPSYVQTTGTTSLDRSTLAATSVDIQGGTLTGRGEVDGAVTVSGTLAPKGFATLPFLPAHGELAFHGPLTLTSAAHASFHIGGTTQGDNYDDVTVTGPLVLAGSLDVGLDHSGLVGLPGTPPSFVPAAGDQFILLSAASITGSFANAADGSRLMTTDGYGSFLVEYLAATSTAPAEVVLTDFQPGTLPTPEPTGLASLALTGAAILSRRRRRYRSS